VLTPSAEVLPAVLFVHRAGLPSPGCDLRLHRRRGDRGGRGAYGHELVTPYPPGIPDILTGERPAEPVLAYLRSVVEAGMNRSVTADPQFRTVHISSSTDEVCGRVGGERVLLTGAEDDYRSCETGE
jgi:hypothetical protein